MAQDDKFTFALVGTFVAVAIFYMLPWIVLAYSVWR